MAAVRDCGFQLVDHSLYAPDMSPQDCRIYKIIKDNNNNFAKVRCVVLVYSFKSQQEQQKAKLKYICSINSYKIHLNRNVVIFIDYIYHKSHNITFYNPNCDRQLPPN